jgi:hypothetical protein
VSARLAQPDEGRRSLHRTTKSRAGTNEAGGTHSPPKYPRVTSRYSGVNLAGERSRVAKYTSAGATELVFSVRSVFAGLVEYWSESDHEEAAVSADGRSEQPGPDEQTELSREQRREARDEVSERMGTDAAEEDDGEETVDEILEIDQTELEELGLTLDDPHQPEPE